MHPTRDQLLGQVISRAIGSPVSLFLGTAGILLTLSPDAWPLGLATLAAEGVWVWTRIRNPRYARESGDELLRVRWRETIQRLEHLTATLDAETSARLSSIVEAQERLLGLYGSEKLVLPHTRAELASLLTHCVSLAEKRHQLHSFLASFRSEEIQRQAGNILSKMEKTHDPTARDLFEQALQQKRQELENYVRLQEAVGRIDGQLAMVQCTFDNMLSQVVRMQSADAVADLSAADPVYQEVNQLTSRVAELEASLSETLSVRSAL